MIFLTLGDGIFISFQTFEYSFIYRQMENLLNILEKLKWFKLLAPVNVSVKIKHQVKYIFHKLLYFSRNIFHLNNCFEFFRSRKEAFREKGILQIVKFNIFHNIFSVIKQWKISLYMYVTFQTSVHNLMQSQFGNPGILQVMQTGS